MNRPTTTASSSSTTRQWSRGGGLSTPAIAPATAGGKRVEYEVESRVRNVEQQLQQKLPAEWREFAGAPMQIQYYGKTINTFRDNPQLAPSDAYVKHAMTELRRGLEREKLSVFTDAELRDIVLQEWRTDMTRSVWQARLNRHGSKDGPIVRRSKSGIITVTSQPTPGEKLIIDELARRRAPKSK